MSSSNRDRFIGASDDLMIAYVTELNDNDVLMGRGSPSTGYEGNLRFRQLVRERRADYLRSDRRKEKQKIAEEIIETVLHRGGRFLQRITTLEEAEKLRVPPRTQAWRIIPPSTALYIKVKQLMRDVGPETEQKRRERREESRKQHKQETGIKTEKKDRKPPAASSTHRDTVQLRSTQDAEKEKRREVIPSIVRNNQTQIEASAPYITNADLRTTTTTPTQRPDEPRSSNASNSIPEAQTPVDLARQLLTALQRTQQPQQPQQQQSHHQQQQQPQVNLSDLIRSLGGGGVPPLVLPPAQNNNHGSSSVSSLARLQPAAAPASLQNGLPELLHILSQNNPNMALPPLQQQQQQYVAPVPAANNNSSSQHQQGHSVSQQLQTQSSSQPQSSNLVGGLQQQQQQQGQHQGDPSQQSTALLNTIRSMQDLNNVDQDLLVLLFNVNFRR